MGSCNCICGDTCCYSLLTYIEVDKLGCNQLSIEQYEQPVSRGKVISSLKREANRKASRDFKKISKRAKRKAQSQ